MGRKLGGICKAEKADELSNSKIISNKKFNVDSCTEEELIKRCRELKFSPSKTDLCINLFIKRIPSSELAETYFIEPSSMAVKKLRLKKKLNTNN